MSVFVGLFLKSDIVSSTLLRICLLFYYFILYEKCVLRLNNTIKTWIVLVWEPGIYQVYTQCFTFQIIDLFIVILSTVLVQPCLSISFLFYVIVLLCNK